MTFPLLPLAVLVLPALVGGTRASAAETVPSAAELRAAGVATLTGEWKDGARGDRIVPWRAYLPAKTDRPVPVVIVSHGLGGSRDGLGYLGEALAAHGIATVHLQHAGSDTAVWQGKGALRIGIDMKAAMSAENATLRRGDVVFALARLTRDAAPGADTPFAGRLDTSRAGIAGHSFGAFTALQVAGMTTGDGAVRDPRIKAALVLSPPAPPVTLPALYDGITIPTFVFTGTADTAIGTTDAKERLKVYPKSRS